MKIFLLIFFLFFCLALYSLPSFRDQADNEALVDALVASLSDTELLGQLFFLGYQGKTPPGELLTWVRERNLGGVKIFTRNVENLKSLAHDIYSLQKLASETRFQVPLFVATDQEGGWVRHIKDDLIVTPGNLALAATGVPGDAYLTGYYIGCELNLIGINMNFAPDVDVYSNPENSGIGPRAFSSDPVQTGLYGVAYFNGLLKAGVIAVAKHFPGHGGADLDSHGYLPEINIDFHTLWERELVPYRFLIKEGLSAIMTAHIAYPVITGNKIPATLSAYFCTDVLRQQLGFKGVLITDSLEMWGVRADFTDFAEISRHAILAGDDMVLIAHREDLQEKTWKSLKEIIKTDSIFRKRVRESAGRIIRQKLKYFKGEKAINPFPDYAHVEEKIRQLQQEYANDFVFQTSCRSITVIKDKFIPYNRQKDEKLLLLGQYPEFIREGLARYPGAGHYEFSYAPIYFAPDEEKTKIKELVKRFDTVIFCLANINSMEVLQSLKPFNRKVIVISALTPVYLDKLPWVETAIAVYGTGELSFRAGFAALEGDFKPGGKLPLDFVK